MKRVLYISALVIFSLCCLSLQGQERKYPVVFYNVENLFDTLKTPNVYDEEFTPDGVNKWNSAKYWKKISNLEQVFYGIASAAKSYPTIIGVAEIENRNVLEDVVAAKSLQKANYQIVHYDSPDARGVDVALFYRPDQFKYIGSKPIRTVVEGLPDFKTRDILMVWGTIEDELFHIFVCHWPSRRGGQFESEARRVGAAQTVRNAVDSVTKINPSTKIIIMGDLNDDPIDKSINITLGAKGKAKEVTESDLFNPFYELFKSGYGTLAYQDAWNLFDNIIVNENLLNSRTGKIKLYKSDSYKYMGYIFDKPFLRQQSGQFKNYPFRTYVGTSFQGGYSDHFPVFIYLK